MSPLSTLEKARAELYRRRAELLDLRDEHALEAQGAGEPEPDFTDRATAEEIASRTDRLDEGELRELREIEAALARIDEGSYGRCERCGRRIGRPRLLAIPETRTCIDCAEIDEERARPIGRRAPST